MKQALSCVFNSCFLVWTLQFKLRNLSKFRDNRKGIQEAELRNSLLMWFRRSSRYPNNGKVPSDTQIKPWMDQGRFGKARIKTQILTSKTTFLTFSLSRRKSDPKKNAILVYMQVDGQPVDSSAWNSEKSIPFLNWWKKSWELGKILNLEFIDGKIDFPEWKILL